MLCRSSATRRRSACLEQFPSLEPHIEDLLPKKKDLIICKCQDHITLVLDPAGEPIFFQSRTGPYIPTLRLLHRFPDVLPKFTVDRGAIRFVLSGANIMAPGLTSAGGSMDTVEGTTVVGVFAEGKEHALAIGVATMATEQILKENKGIAVENTHWLKDDLWNLGSLGDGWSPEVYSFILRRHYVPPSRSRSHSIDSFTAPSTSRRRRRASLARRALPARHAW